MLAVWEGKRRGIGSINNRPTEKECLFLHKINNNVSSLNLPETNRSRFGIIGAVFQDTFVELCLAVIVPPKK